MYQTARFFSEGGRDLVEVTNVHPDTETTPTAWVREPSDDDKAKFRPAWQAYCASKEPAAAGAAPAIEEPAVSAEPSIPDDQLRENNDEFT